MADATADPTVFIEESRSGYVRYHQIDPITGAIVWRWEVHGHCDRRGYCLIGASVDVGGQTVTIRDLAHIEELKARLGRDRLDSEMDVPVTPKFSTCCGADLGPGLPKRFTFRELPVK